MQIGLSITNGVFVTSSHSVTVFVTEYSIGVQ